MSNLPENGNDNEVNQRMDTYKRGLLALGPGRRMAAGGAVLGLISSFLPWYGVSAFGFSASVDGWHGWGFLAALAFLGAGALVLLPVFGVSLQPLHDALPPTVDETRLVLGAGVIAVVTTLLFIVTTGGGGSSLVSAGPAIGAWISLLCGVLVAAGGYTLQHKGA